jgi:pyrophosphatase PpaX
MKEAHLIIFDLDLTLHNTREIHIQGFAHSFKAHMGIIPDLSTFDRMAGKPLDMILRTLFESIEGSAPLPDTMLKELRNTFANFYRQHISTLISAFPGIPETISILQERGYALALLSSKRRSMGERELQSTGLRTFFPITVFRDDIVHPKPSPEGIFRAMQLAQLSPDDPQARGQVTLVGDTEEDVQCAHNAMVQSVYAAWKWGGQESFPRSFPILADFTAHDPSHLLNVFP